jgi:hypothetical protein
MRRVAGKPYVANKEKARSDAQLPQTASPAVTLSRELRPSELFEQCEMDQHKWATVNLEKAKLFFAEEFLLRTVEFPQPQRMSRNISTC